MFIRHLQKRYLFSNLVKTKSALTLAYFIPKISSAEQSIISHSLAKVAREGRIRPERYCDRVGFDMLSSLAISVLLFPQCSISKLRFFLKFDIISFLYKKLFEKTYQYDIILIEKIDLHTKKAPFP